MVVGSTIVRPKESARMLRCHQLIATNPDLSGDVRRPNITGSIKPFDVACSDFTASGALSGGKSSTPWNGKTNVGSSVITDIALAASKYDAKYGASSTVQPTSLRLVHCIKS